MDPDPTKSLASLTLDEAHLRIDELRKSLNPQASKGTIADATANTQSPPHNESLDEPQE